jgi:hypothetical protein
MYLRQSIFILSLFASLTAKSQSQKVNARFEYHIFKTTSEVHVDGVDNDEAWKPCEVAKDFYMVLPMDTSMARVPTEVRMTYDQKNIYLQAVCYHSTDTRYTVESLKRDFTFGKNDNFLLFIDTFDDQTNGFSFGLSAAGAQWDGIMYGGSTVDLSWDNKWISAVGTYPDRYVIEMAIPFKSIRYKKNIMKWGINFSRLDLKTTEKSSWTPIPRQFATASLSHTGFLVWDEAPPTPKVNMSLIPYVLGRRAKDFEKNTPITDKLNAGMDAKISITPSLNLDLTVNPDFSQVDVDRQVTNLDRYELFFPEKRQFFLENGDIFGNFGYATIRPFFSRRIGLGVPIQAGARLSGRINRNWRIGAMDMQTAPVNDSTARPAQNFSMATIQRRLFARSYVGAFFINKQSVDYETPTDPKTPAYSMFNRTGGLEYNLQSRNNQFTGKALVFKSLGPGQKENTDNWVYAGHLQYFSRHWLTAMQIERVGRDFNAEVGYVPRVNFARLGPQAAYLFFPKSKHILSHGPKMISSIFFDTQFNRTDDETTASYVFNFRKLSILTFSATKNYVRLLRPFDPTNSGLETLATGTRHQWYTAGVDYTSRPQKMLTLTATGRYGGYYDGGTKLTVGGDLGYRFQPFVNFLLSTTYNVITLPQPWGRQPFWLVSPRLDITMTNKLFLTTYLQYNQQLDNVNINSRLQWRFKPASDIFIVYTDNYLPENWNVKSRAIVLKFTYWFTL